MKNQSGAVIISLVIVFVNMFLIEKKYAPLFPYSDVYLIATGKLAEYS